VTCANSLRPECPEVRWDHAFTNNHPFNAQRDNNAVTLGLMRC
jgi:hypothetical protein